jgi:hypothetical protein
MSASLPEAFTDLAADLGEVFLDTTLAEGIVRDLPLLSAVVKFARVKQSVTDALLLLKVRRFMQAVDDVRPEERAAFAFELKRDAAFRAKVSETVVFALERADELDKAAILAQLFRALVRRRIDADTFRRLCNAVNQAFAADLRSLAAPNGGEGAPDSDVLRRLLPTGLAELPKRATTPLYPGSVTFLLDPELSPSGRELIAILRGA